MKLRLAVDKIALGKNYHALNFFEQIHLGPIQSMKYNHEYDTVISADDKGVIEYWSPATLQFPETG